MIGRRACFLRFRRVEPTTDVERTILKLFADLLQTPEDELSAADDFFLVGGQCKNSGRIKTPVGNGFDSVNSSTVSPMWVGRSNGRWVEEIELAAT